MNFDNLYDKIQKGEISRDEARQKFSLSYVKTAHNYILDVNRDIRNDIPEIIYAEYKTLDQVIELTETILERAPLAIISRFKDNQQIAKHFAENHTVHAKDRICVVGDLPEPTDKTVLVVSGGCADHPVASEVHLMLKALGINSLLFEDRGIAHPTRVLEAVEAAVQKNAKVAIAIAGMEASLATFVASLLPMPIIGVPTSVGYGYKAHETALISMLASCAPNLTVVNIDGGVRAAVVAALIARG